VARIRVQVPRQTDGDGFMSEVSRTLVVDAHGAVIRLVVKVQASELLVIEHVNTGEEKQSRVVGFGAEAASQNGVAIEFTEPAPRFWRIDSRVRIGGCRRIESHVSPWDSPTEFVRNEYSGCLAPSRVRESLRLSKQDHWSY
jgi:hypothetical protein